MNLRGIVSLSGKPGLFKVIGQNRSGFVLESLDEAKTKVVTTATSKLATLEDITIFGNEDDITLLSVLAKMKETVSSKNVPEAKADGKILREYFTFISPDHDSERVYSSDIKKIITWYGILSKLPLWNEEPASAAEPQSEEVKEEAPVKAEEVVAEKPAKKTRKKKEDTAE